MKIGYSFWGFLGSGITDTPDGGRSHRRTFVDGITSAGHEILFLQSNRDLAEARDDVTGTYSWHDGLPSIDVLFLEWRWPIPMRNITTCDAVGHTCDLHRQDQLMAHYTFRHHIPTVIWDKDLRLSATSPLRQLSNVAICEAALQPNPGAETMLFPVDDAVLDAADPVALAKTSRPLQLVYIGNQYDRDAPFDAFFASAATQLTHRVAGKWDHITAWPEVNFTGRCSYTDVHNLYMTSIATVLLLPARYARAGQMTQRLFEAVLAGCLPLTPTDISRAASFTPLALHVANGQEVLDRINHFSSRMGSRSHVLLLASCLAHLNIFRLSHQLDALNKILERLTDAPRARLHHASTRLR